MTGKRKVGDKPAEPSDLTKLAGLAGEWIEATEAAAAGLIAAELAVVNAVLVSPEDLTDAERAAREKAADAKTEEGFDNLPV